MENITTTKQKKASLMAELKILLDPFIKKYELTGPISNDRSIQERVRKILADIPDELLELKVVPLHSEWILYKEDVEADSEDNNINV